MLSAPRIFQPPGLIEIYIKLLVSAEKQSLNRGKTWMKWRNLKKPTGIKP
jgi:hypothetical protein